MKKLFILFIIINIIFSGCATVANRIGLKPQVEKGDKRLTINSDPINAKILFFDITGKILMEKTTPSYDILPFECVYIELSKDGYIPERIYIKNNNKSKTKFNPWYLCNLIPLAAGISMSGLSYNNFRLFREYSGNRLKMINFWDGNHRFNFQTV